ncbi:MAG: hypothetical protein QOJ62_3161, partial [Actinomycetota bacterium]|nr:hypothetical protein [Actinomycetota bacterium]
MTGAVKAEDCVVRSLLARNAAERPESALASFESGTTWTNREALEQACSAA